MPLWNKNGITMLSSLPSTATSFLSSTSSLLFSHYLKTFHVSSRLIWKASCPISCCWNVNPMWHFSLISSLRSSPFPSYKLCKSQRNNLTNLNQFRFGLFRPLGGRRGHSQYIPVYSTRLKDAGRCWVASVQNGCSCLHLRDVESLTFTYSLGWKLDFVE